MDDIFGKKLSASSVSNITKEFEEVRKSWLARPIESEYYFIYVDALYIATAYYTVIGLRRDLKRDILGVYNIPTESAKGWRKVFKDLKNKGLQKCLMVVADGITGLENVVKEEFPSTKLKKCLLHRMIYTTNWVERLNKAIRKTEKVRNSFPNPDSALNLICACLINKYVRMSESNPR